MSVTEKEYLILSELSYYDYRQQLFNNTISNIFSEEYLDNLNSKQLERYKMFEEHIEELHNWELINHVKDSSGFAGSAFKNERGEIVFAFRGTEPTTRDQFTNANITIMMTCFFHNLGK